MNTEGQEEQELGALLRYLNMGINIGIKHGLLDNLTHLKHWQAHNAFCL